MTILKGHAALITAPMNYTWRPTIDTSMDEVATPARVSKNTPYTLHPSKEALFALVIDAYNEGSRMHFVPDDFDNLKVDEEFYPRSATDLSTWCAPHPPSPAHAHSARLMRLTPIVGHSSNAPPQQTPMDIF